MKAGSKAPRVDWCCGEEGREVGGGHTTALEVDCDTQTHSSLVISSLPFLPLSGQKAHRAKLLSSLSSHQFRGCRKLITELHQNLNRQFQAAFLFRAGYR